MLLLLFYFHFIPKICLFLAFQVSKRVAYLFFWPLLQARKFPEKFRLPPSNLKYVELGNTYS